MKIRALKEPIFTQLTKEEIKCYIFGEYEDVEYPIVLSNNECSKIINKETNDEDSPLSFLVKFKASNVSPSMIPAGVGGGVLSDNKKKNIKHNDKKSKFTSINLNHHNYSIDDAAMATSMIDEMINLNPRSFVFEMEQIDHYILAHLDEPEWIKFFNENDKWRKYRRAILVADFKKKQSDCEITFPALEKHQKNNPMNLLEDLKFLVKYRAIDPSLVNKLKKIFSDL